MDGNVDVIRPCPSNTYGYMTRFCKMVSENETAWDEPVTEYCLSLSPAPGMGFVDMIYNVSESRARFIAPSARGFVDGLAFKHNIDRSAITAHRIAELENMHSFVQMRVTLPVDDAKKLYEEIMESDRADDIAEQLMKNNNVGLRYQYLTFKGNLQCDITYIGERVLTVNEIPDNKFVDYLKEYWLWISICAIELILIIVVSFYKKRSSNEVKEPLV